LEAGVSSRLRIALLYGGRSAEHSVSVVSARSVMEALDPDRYEVVPIAITRQGAWLISGTSPLELTAPGGALPVADERGTPVALRPERGELGTGAGAVDVVFPLLHGPYGEDGTVQGLLELADLPYVGSGVLASALAMDKAMAKVVFAQAGLPQVPHLVVTEPAWRDDSERVEREVAGTLGWPVFVKPARLGSSIGISKVRAAAGLADALGAAFAHDAKVLVERGLAARELECGVLGLDGLECTTSVVGEIVPANEFYDFEAKYLDESKLLIPAPVADEIAERVRALALRAFAALDCEGFARVDFFWDEASGEVLINEVNTIPGFTPKSMFPLLWQASGVSYRELIDRLVGLAVERHERRKG
jgi:D-alanine-D-alanine ligase